ncbi:MAG: TolC family protein [Sedimentisphaerales bacterium]
MKQQAVLIVGVIIFTFTPSVRGSQQPGDANNLVKLEDYLQYASRNSANLKAMFEQWRAALEEVPQAKALPDPQLQYGYYTRQSDMQMNQMVGVMQMFPWFGKIDARTEAAAKSADAAQQKYQAARLALFKEVKDGFYEYVYLGKATDIAAENLELLKHFEEVARTKHMTTEAGHPDVIRAQVEIAKMEDVLRGLDQLREPTISRLRTTLTLPPDTNLPWPKQQKFEAASLDYGRLMTLLVQKNPELAGLDFEAMAAKSKIELAKKNFYPDIGVGVQWTQFDKSGGNSGRDAVALMFQMNIPLWRDSYSAGQRQAQAQKAGIELQKIDTENVLLTKAATAHYEYENSARKIRLYRDMLIPKGKELLQASEAAYRSGMVDFLSLIDAQRMLLEYYLSYERALVDNRQKLAELEMLTGTELDSIQK